MLFLYSGHKLFHSSLYVHLSDPYMSNASNLSAINNNVCGRRCKYIFHIDLSKYQPAHK